MKLNSLRLTNFNCFADHEVSLLSRFNLIVGNNATGKTTLLNGMAVGLGAFFLGLPGPARPRNIQHEEARLEFYRHGDAITAEPQFPVRVSCRGEVEGKSGTWCRELAREDGRTTRQDAAWIQQLAEEMRRRVKAGEPVVLPVISYYGTGRLWVQMRQRKIELLKPDSRFMGYQDCLNPAADAKRLVEWFKTQEITAIQQGQPIGTLEACRGAILKCLPDAKRVYFDVAHDQLMFQLGDRSLPFMYLSDGFRNMVAMVADIAVRCATLNPHLRDTAAEQTPGVVLIDELDLHLHPKWQRRVINDLLATFPRVQFVGTSHSPFVIQSLPMGDGMRLINLDNPAADDVTNRSVEDITEEVQGVELPQRSQRFLDMMDAAERYYELLRHAGGASPEEIARLRGKLDELSLPYSDDPAFQALLKSQRVAAGLGQEEQ